MKYMKVLVPKYSGFCSGVQQAENKLMAIKQKNPNKKICILGELIHNKMYIEYLEKEGIHTVETLEESQLCDIVVIRTHGINRNLEQQLREIRKTVDLTCFKVKQLQKNIYEYSQKDFFIVITGKKNHPEVLGLISYAAKYKVLESSQDIDEFITSSYYHDLSKILVVTQTTGKRKLFLEAYDKIKKNHSESTEIIVEDSFCTGSELKEKETLKLIDKADVVFVVGDSMSSNAQKLYKEVIVKKAATYFISNVTECKEYREKIKNFKTALVVSSSSTPCFVEEEVVKYLESI